MASALMNEDVEPKPDKMMTTRTRGDDDDVGGQSRGEKIEGLKKRVCKLGSLFLFIFSNLKN